MRGDPKVPRPGAINPIDEAETRYVDGYVHRTSTESHQDLFGP